jgi:hypothetical protein
MDALVVDLPSEEESEIARQFGRMIGSGAFRDVFRIPGSRWVYKFEDAEYGSANCNQREFLNYTSKRKTLPEGVDFPEMHFLPNGAIAAEYIDGMLGVDIHSLFDPCVCASHGITNCWRTMVKPVADAGMRDLHGRNVMVAHSDKKIYIIDIGEYGNES